MLSREVQLRIRWDNAFIEGQHEAPADFNQIRRIIFANGYANAAVNRKYSGVASENDPDYRAGINKYYENYDVQNVRQSRARGGYARF